MPPLLTIYIDADACPVKDEVYRVAERYKMRVIVVANATMRIPTNPLVELVARGVDMFDCVLPTRVARNGTAFTSKGSISIKAGAYKADFRPIEEDCDCFACRHFTRAYLRHLLNVGEILGLRMLSVHNTRLFIRVMEQVRAAIVEGSFAEFRREFVANYVPTQKVLLARAAVAER